MQNELSDLDLARVVAGGNPPAKSGKIDNVGGGFLGALTNLTNPLSGKGQGKAAGKGQRDIKALRGKG